MVPVVTDVTTLPPVSSTLTTGCTARATPVASDALGSVVTTSFEGAPTVTLTVVETAAVSDPSENVTV